MRRAARTGAIGSAALRGDNRLRRASDLWRRCTRRAWAIALSHTRASSEVSDESGEGSTLTPSRRPLEFRSSTIRALPVVRSNGLEMRRKPVHPSDWPTIPCFGHPLANYSQLWPSSTAPYRSSRRTSRRERRSRSRPAWSRASSSTATARSCSASRATCCCG